MKNPSKFWAMEKKGIFLVVTCILILFITGFFPAAFAATVTSSQDGNWSDGTTWDGGNAPTGSDNVIIDNGHTVTWNQVGTYTGDITIRPSGTLFIPDGTDPTVKGNTITNEGNFNFGSSGGGILRIDGTVTLDGGGTVNLSNTGNTIDGDSGAESLSPDILINVDNKIRGSGAIGQTNLSLVNHIGGIIEADQSTQLLVASFGGQLNNTGIIRSVGTGDLRLGATVVNLGGTIEANDSSTFDFVSDVVNGTLTVNDSAHLYFSGSMIGGTFTNTEFGTITVSGTGLGSVENFTNHGIVHVNGKTLRFVGPTVNNNLISLTSHEGSSHLQFDGNVTLTGGGMIDMSNYTGSQVYHYNFGLSNDKLTNVDNIIQGQGTIGGTGNFIENQESGIIKTDQFGTLILSGNLNNAGVISSTDSSTLQISSSTINTDGIIEANNTSTILHQGSITNGTITINDEAELDLWGTIQGANVTNTDLGTITVSSYTYLDGLTNNGTVNILNDKTLITNGDIVNYDTINLVSTGGTSEFRMDGTVTLSGNGTINLTDFTGNWIRGHPESISNDMLINMDNKIRGAGNIGLNELKIENLQHGNIVADQITELKIDPDSNGFNNTGNVHSLGLGTLTLTGGSFENGGSIFLNGTNSTMGKILTNGVLTNSCNGSISIVNGTFDNDGTLITYGLFTKTGGTFDNSGTIQFSSPTPTPNPNTGTFSSIPTICEADLTVTKSLDINSLIGDFDLTYNVMVHNNGPHLAQNVTVIDTIPAETSLVSTLGCAEDPNGIPICNLGYLKPDDSTRYTINLSSTPFIGNITNQAIVSTDNIDSNGTNDKIIISSTILPPCILPESGDWMITESCGISTDVMAPGSVIIQNDSVLIIFSDGSLTILAGENIIVVNGSTLRILEGSQLKINSTG